jgi:hypothetical protein
LTEASDAIWVVEILRQVESGSVIGEPDLFFVEVLKVLKGPKIPDKDGPWACLGLRYVPYVVDEGGFAERTRHLVFLKRIQKHDLPVIPDPSGKKLNGMDELLALRAKLMREFMGKVLYENAQTEGTHWEVSREFDLKKLAGLSVKDAIRVLLKDLVESKKRHATLFEKKCREALQAKEDPNSTVMVGGGYARRKVAGEKK